MDQKGEHDHNDADDDQYTFHTHVGLNFSVLLSFLHYLRILAYFEKTRLLLDALALGFWRTRLGGRVAANEPKVPAGRSGSRGRSANGYRLFGPPCSSPHSIATRPRISARSPMSGASLRATEADAGGREGLIQSLRAVQLDRYRAHAPPLGSFGAPILLHAAGEEEKRPWSVWWPTGELACRNRTDAQRIAHLYRWHAVWPARRRPFPFQRHRRAVDRTGQPSRHNAAPAASYARARR
jgi:hypothetical protein